MKLTKQAHLLIFGPQGSGKGTQAKLLEKRFGLQHISSGEVLRTIAKTNTTLGKYLKKQLSTGTLTPIDKLMQVFDVYMKRVPSKQSIIFDGFARQITETKLFLQRLKKLKRNLNLVLWVDIPEKESIARLSKRGYCGSCGRVVILSSKLKLGSRCKVCGGTITQRSDDEPAAIRKRLRIYRKRTMRVINFFKKQNLVAKIEGKQTIEAVHRNILLALKKRRLIK